MASLLLYVVRRVGTSRSRIHFRVRRQLRTYGIECDNQVRWKLTKQLRFSKIMVEVGRQEGLPGRSAHLLALETKSEIQKLCSISVCGFKIWSHVSSYQSLEFWEKVIELFCHTCAPNLMTVSADNVNCKLVKER